jgi:hypothetical protein
MFPPQGLPYSDSSDSIRRRYWRGASTGRAANARLPRAVQFALRGGSAAGRRQLPERPPTGAEGALIVGPRLVRADRSTLGLACC